MINLYSEQHVFLDPRNYLGCICLVGGSSAFLFAIIHQYQAHFKTRWGFEHPLRPTNIVEHVKYIRISSEVFTNRVQTDVAKKCHVESQNKCQFSGRNRKFTVRIIRDTALHTHSKANQTNNSCAAPLHIYSVPVLTRQRAAGHFTQIHHTKPAEGTRQRTRPH